MGCSDIPQHSRNKRTFSFCPISLEATDDKTTSNAVDATDYKAPSRARGHGTVFRITTPTRSLAADGLESGVTVVMSWGLLQST